MLQVAKEIVDLQDSLNGTITPNWRGMGYNWNRYIWTECAELIESANFKHWKKCSIDYENMLVELVDIFHFIISDGLTVFSNKSLSKIINEKKNNSYSILRDIEDIRRRVEDIVCLSICPKHFNKEHRELNVEAKLEALFQVWNSLFINKDIYKYYLAKNILNIFRNRNGYNEGSYIKVWNGKEDNTYVMSLIDSYYGYENTFEKVYKELEKIYNGIKNG